MIIISNRYHQHQCAISASNLMFGFPSSQLPSMLPALADTILAPTQSDTALSICLCGQENVDN